MTPTQTKTIYIIINPVTGWTCRNLNHHHKHYFDAISCLRNQKRAAEEGSESICIKQFNMKEVA